MRQPQNPRSIQFQEDLSEEELVRDWTLSERDRAQALRCRGDDNRRRFAIQMCASRHTGRFLEDFAGVLVRILNYIIRQPDIAPSSIVRPLRPRGHPGWLRTAPPGLSRLQQLRFGRPRESGGASSFTTCPGHAPGRPEAASRRCPAILARHPACGIHAESLGGFDRRHWPPGDLRPHRNAIKRGATPSAESDR
ncbi:MAG: DUF4158 domain-containing protein [Acidobacteriaceae bacterium]